MALLVIHQSKVIMGFLNNKVVSNILTVFQNPMKSNTIIYLKSKLSNVEIKIIFKTKKINSIPTRYQYKEIQKNKLQSQILNFL